MVAAGRCAARKRHVWQENAKIAAEKDHSAVEMSVSTSLAMPSIVGFVARDVATGRTAAVAPVYVVTASSVVGALVSTLFATEGTAVSVARSVRPVSFALLVNVHPVHAKACFQVLQSVEIPVYALVKIPSTVDVAAKFVV